MPTVTTNSPESVGVDLLKELIRFPSVTGEEGEIADFVEARVQGDGLDSLRLEDNVAAVLGDGDDTLLLNTHLDVVPPADEHPFDPFTPVVREGHLYGRGSVDAKASGAAMLTALRSLVNDGWRPEGGRVLLALTSHEESGGRKNGLQDLRPHLPQIDAAVVGEPTSLRCCVAQRGLLILKLHGEGEAVHAGRSHRGRNAIAEAATAIRQLEALELNREDPYLGTPDVTVTQVEGGSAKNVVPERCACTVDVRTTPAYSHDEIVDIVRDTVDASVEVYSDRLVPCSTPETARIVRAAQRAAPKESPFGSPTCSDWVFLHDIPTVKLGPGRSFRSHTADERIAVREVEQAVSVYRTLIRSYFDD